MAYVDFAGLIHTATKRDYLERVRDHDKAACAVEALKWGEAYWDGDRSTGYGGYRYDGRWRPVAEAIARHYGLQPGQRVLDVGCGKAFLLHDLAAAVPGLEVTGIDISDYAVAHAPDAVRPFLRIGDAAALPWPDACFDLVISLNVLHNLYLPERRAAVAEMERVGRGGRHITVEAYRNETEKVNLLYWQLTCRAVHTPEEWEWLFKEWGYSGDHGFVFFE